MLVLTRRVNEVICVGDDIKIIVMQIKGKQVRLGIKAGPEVVVHREEIYQKIKAEEATLVQAEKSWAINCPNCSHQFVLREQPKGEIRCLSCTKLLTICAAK